jgi:hypothetical protein
MITSHQHRHPIQKSSKSQRKIINFLGTTDPIPIQVSMLMVEQHQAQGCSAQEPQDDPLAAMGY